MTYREKFLEKYLKVPVIEFDNNVSKKPLVSVSVTTYQHGDYISKCLDGILMQKTNFDFEVLVGEDASSDKTRDICKEYASKHPDKIKLFLHSRKNNIIVYGKPTGSFNAKYNVYSANGKYLAICEGDDFWADPLKLQKQVDFLEANDDYGMIFSDVVMIDEDNNEIETTAFHNKIKSLYKSGSIFWDLLSNNFVNTLTICVRKDLYIDYLANIYEEYAYDYRFWLHISSISKIKYVDEIWASYRVHNLGMSRSNDFFIKRTPLVQQSALVNHILNTKNQSGFINHEIFSRITFGILRDKNLSTKEKSPLINLLKKKPRLIIFLLKWLVGNKFVNLLFRKSFHHN